MSSSIFKTLFLYGTSIYGKLLVKRTKHLQPRIQNDDMHSMRLQTNEISPYTKFPVFTTINIQLQRSKYLMMGTEATLKYNYCKRILITV